MFVVGEFKDGFRHGEGTYYHANNDRYEGEFRYELSLMSVVDVEHRTVIIRLYSQILRIHNFVKTRFVIDVIPILDDKIKQFG